MLEANVRGRRFPCVNAVCGDVGYSHRHPFDVAFLFEMRHNVQGELAFPAQLFANRLELEALMPLPSGKVVKFLEELGCRGVNFLSVGHY